MTTFRPRVRAALLVAGALLVTALAAHAADVFDFIPSGGRTLLAKVLGKGAPPAEVQALVSGKHTRDEWLAYLKQHKALAGAQALKEPELLTLADYLAHNMPLATAKAPSSPTQANWEKQLPIDGRDMALEYCQSCHIITVVITQDKVKSGWLGTMHKPSHIQVKLSEEQRDALADYLVINANIPIEQVPEDLRAGGATY